jgi:hypothetical protein
MEYALLSYQTTNLGDEIQSLAAKQFLPATDLLIDRDALGHVPGSVPAKLILNGWHTHRPESWPPAGNLIPLVTSFHITAEPSEGGGAPAAETLLRGKNLTYLRSRGPVGARDLWTLRLLEDHDVEAYFSACLTLTLGTGEKRKRGGYVCAVDVRGPLADRLQRRFDDGLVSLTHGDALPGTFEERAARARRLLSIYATARCVVTTRLHCALPCLALGTPVLFIEAATDGYRFDGLRELLHTLTPGEFLEDEGRYDLEDPPPNSGAYLGHRESLIESVNDFMFDGESPSRRPLFPFEPEVEVEPLIRIERSLAHWQRVAADATQCFTSIFRPGRNYTSDAPPDFLRDLARVHLGMGNREEARRLLAFALTRRENAPYIKELLASLGEAEKD